MLARNYVAGEKKKVVDDVMDGRVVVVTGGTSGIGRAITERFLSGGATVVAISRNPKKLRDPLNDTADGDDDGIGKRNSFLAIRADVTVPREVRRAAEIVAKKFLGLRPLSVLVNNAGVSGPIKNLTDITLDDWNATITANLTGTFLCCKYFVPLMIKEQAGRSAGNRSIINISSMVAKRPSALRSPYSASKLGVVGVTRSLSAELGRYGITVNALCPGAVEGDRIEDVIRSYSKVRGESVARTREKIVERLPLKRFARPEEIAAAVWFLASNEARFITGQDFDLG